jgi:hypothetical protein
LAINDDDVSDDNDDDDDDDDDIGVVEHLLFDVFEGFFDECTTIDPAFGVVAAVVVVVVAAAAAAVMVVSLFIGPLREMKGYNV